MVKPMYIEQEAKDNLIKQAKVKYVETTSEDTTEQTQSDGSEDTGCLLYTSCGFYKIRI